MSLRAVRFAVVAAALVGMLPLVVRRVGDPDYFWHLADASWITAHRGLPTVDLFTFSRSGSSLTDHEWLGELMMSAAQRARGELAVSLLFGAITWGGFLLLLQRIRLRPASAVVVAAALFLGALVGNLVWGPRLQMITFALVCLELYWIDAFVLRGRRLVLLMPAVIALWANLHGGFVMGPALLAVAAGVELLRGWSAHDTAALARARVLGLVTLASGLGSMITPYGPGGLTYAVRTQFDAVQEGLIAEWRSPDFHSLTERGLEAAILLLLITFAISRSVSLWDLVLAGLGTVLALQSVRHASLFVALAIPVLAWQASGIADLVWAQLRPRLPRPPHGWEMAVVAAAVIGSVGAVGVLGRLLSQQASSTRANFPVAAADWLDANSTTGTRIFDLYGWGGYLVRRFYPQPNRTVYVYEEADHMGDTVLTRYLDVINLSSDWRTVLDQAGVDVVVFPPDTALTSALAELPEWRLVHADTVADVYVRTPSV